MLRDVFDEAERRDPTHTRTWVALVDGNNHQINRIETEAADRGVEVTIVVDLIHVLEYLWRAAHAFLLHRILRRHDKKRIGQQMRLPADCHLPLLHAFEQRALHLRGSAVDFVGEH